MGTKFLKITEKKTKFGAVFGKNSNNELTSYIFLKTASLGHNCTH